jgi:hypothetical protein
VVHRHTGTDERAGRHERARHERRRTTTTFSTQHPYMPGSLFVKVNGVNWTGDIASQDPTTGSFTFTHAPKAGADIVVDYRAA